MSSMYIGNASRQIQDFHYRVPEKAQVIRQTIKIGEQIKISGDLSIQDIESIVRQHAKYGLISVDEIASKGRFASLCFQLDKPINPAKIEMLANRNMGVLMERGREQRKNAAIVMATTLGANGRERGLGDLAGVEVETIEEDTPNARHRQAATGEGRIEEKTIVNPEDNQGRGRSRLTTKGKKSQK